MSQPFRFIAHNGEINTIQGNRLWMRARKPVLEYPGVASADELEPGRLSAGSDSLSLDNVVELLYHGGRSVPHALMMLVPEAWEQFPDMDPARRAFYDYHAGLTEQWDGPAALASATGYWPGPLGPERRAASIRDHRGRASDRRLGGRHGRGRSGRP